MGLLVPASTILAALLIATLAVKGGIAGKGARVRALGFSGAVSGAAVSIAMPGPLEIGGLIVTMVTGAIALGVSLSFSGQRL
jgi:hypothetical protein